MQLSSIHLNKAKLQYQIQYMNKSGAAPGGKGWSKPNFLISDNL